MKLRILAIFVLLSPLCLVTPTQAQNTNPLTPNNSTAPVRPTADQVLNACVQNRADTLPIPFTDVSPRDWAFKAVMNLYYCGAIGPNTPPEVIERLRNNLDRRSPENGYNLPDRAFSSEINRELF
mgnify:CR=1 FL=1